MNVCDGKYVGSLTPEQVMEQFEYRIRIHESYAGLVVQQPSRFSPITYGDYEYHMWAINGYEEAIGHLKEKILPVCTLPEAFATIYRVILKIFRR